LTGARKYRLAQLGLLALCAGFALASWRHVPEALFSEFSWGVVGLLLAFGVPNVGEHVAKALSSRREVKP
jgi:hypothetical protein